MHQIPLPDYYGDREQTYGEHAAVVMLLYLYVYIYTMFGCVSLCVAGVQVPLRV